ncbi:MAG: hypothetical protein WC556_08375 [Candidatus Methanoperedens sp.]
MGEKKQLNVRIPLELQEKIENDGRPKVEIVIEALELYFASKKQQNDSNGDDSANNNANESDSNTSQNDSSISYNDSNNSKLEQNYSNEAARMKTEIEFLRAKIDDLLKLLHQEQVLHIQTQRMLTAPQPAAKKWWQFWK